MSRYEVEGQEVVVLNRRGRWTAIVARAPVAGWYPSEAEAWAAGVREATRGKMRRGDGTEEGRPD
jgi:hypothetical protein